MADARMTLPRSSIGMALAMAMGSLAPELLPHLPARKKSPREMRTPADVAERKAKQAAKRARRAARAGYKPAQGDDA